MMDDWAFFLVGGGDMARDTESMVRFAEPADMGKVGDSCGVGEEYCTRSNGGSSRGRSREAVARKMVTFKQRVCATLL